MIHLMLTNLAALAVLLPDGAAGEVMWSPPAPVVRSVEAAPPAPESGETPASGSEDRSVAPEKPRKHARDRHAGAGGCKQRKKGCKRGKERPEPPVDAPSPEEVGLREARVQRARTLELAQPLADAGRLDEAARITASAADLYKDPALYLAAAEFDLADPQADQHRLARADRMVQAARRLLVEPAGWRIDRDEVPRLSEGTDELARYARSRQVRLQQLRRGKAELACGSTFLAAGGVGVAILLTGAVMSSRVTATRELYTGQDEAYLVLLDETQARAKTMIAAGAAVTAIGAAIGVPLTVAGVQERRGAREAARETPSFRVAPSVAGVSITGRF